MYTGLFLSFLFYPNGLLVYVCKTHLFPLTPLMQQHLGSQPSVIELIRVYKSHLGNLDAGVSLINLTVKNAAGPHVCPPQNQRLYPGEKYPYVQILYSLPNTALVILIPC